MVEPFIVVSTNLESLRYIEAHVRDRVLDK